MFCCYMKAYFLTINDKIVADDYSDDLKRWENDLNIATVFCAILFSAIPANIATIQLLIRVSLCGE